MVSRLSLIKSVPWFTKAAEAARFSATRPIWSKCLTSVSVYLTLLPSEATSTVPVPSMETPAVKLPAVLTLSALISKLSPETNIMLSPVLSCVPPLKITLSWFILVLARASVSPLPMIFKTVLPLAHLMLVKSMSLKL